MNEQPQPETVFDSDQQQLALLYGKALLGASGSAGKVDEVVREFKAFVVQCLDAFPKFEAALASPRISLDEKQTMLDRVLSGNAGPTLVNFLKVLCRRGRVEHVRAIQRAVEEMRDEELGRMRVEVRCATALNDSQRQAISAQLKKSFGKEAVLVERIEPALIGGVILRIGDKVFDGSIQGRLEQLGRAVSVGIQKATRDKGHSLILS